MEHTKDERVSIVGFHFDKCKSAIIVKKENTYTDVFSFLLVTFGRGF